MLKLRALFITLLVGAACVSDKTPPAPAAQAEIDYGQRIYVADQSAGPGGICAWAGPSTTTGTVATAALTTFFGKTGAEAALFSTASRTFHNCYVRVAPGTLQVDQFTVSNDQYQLCVDSGFCTDPDPSDVERERVCSATDDSFWNCPVVGLTQDHAARYCQFVGLRLPSGFEQMMYRTAGADTPEKVLEFSRDNGAPGNACVEAVLDGCGSQANPMALDSTPPVGAAANDRLEGIFDLTGNVREWSRDLVAINRPEAARELPWFCIAPVSTSTSFNDWPTECPPGPDPQNPYTCVYGRRMLDNGTFREDLPVCIIPPSLALENGALPSSSGSGIEHDAAVNGRGHVGIGPYVRTVYTTGLEFVNRGVGFRCVGIPGSDDEGILESVAGP